MGVFELVQSTRPWSLPVTVAPVLLGSAVALRDSPSGTVTLPSFLVTMLGALSVHTFGNLINTLEDFKCGVDRADNKAADRALVDRHVTPVQVRNLALVCVVIALGCAAVLTNKLVTLSTSIDGSNPLVSFFLLIAAGGAIAYAYTGWPLRLKYRSLGDVCIFIAFGPLLCVGASFVHTGHINTDAIWLSVPLGLLTEAILHANNARDIRVDIAAGANTLANTIGFKHSYTLFQAMYFTSFALLPVLAVLWHSYAFLLPAIMLPQLKPLFAAFLQHDPESENVAIAKKTDGDVTSNTAAAAVDPNLVCDLCGKFSAGFGVLLAIAVLVA